MLWPNATSWLSRSYQISATTAITTTQVIFWAAVSLSSVVRSRAPSWRVGSGGEFCFMQDIVPVQPGPFLKLSQRQQLALTPQLQQSIRLMPLRSEESRVGNECGSRC